MRPAPILRPPCPTIPGEYPRRRHGETHDRIGHRRLMLHPLPESLGGSPPPNVRALPADQRSGAVVRFGRGASLAPLWTPRSPPSASVPPRSDPPPLTRHLPVALAPPL